ncbi:MAG: hypothetical protein IT378_03190 [Sandaracinaceae bacterium]|nr:hypothetical protein [Sandaracinaceae bacterium]
MRATLLSALILLPAIASAQELSDGVRTSAVARMRALADCLHARDRDMQEIMRLLADAERQRGSSDVTLRRAAEATIEALIARASDVQRQARTCAAGGDLPSPGTRVEERDAPPDSSADSVATDAPSLRVIESDASLASNVRVVRGEHVDGEGRFEPGAIRDAVHAIGSRVAQCYESYLDRGALDARELDLVFTVSSGSTSVRGVAIERSTFGDARLETCVRRAAEQIRPRQGPAGGEATFSYRLRFGR